MVWILHSHALAQSESYFRTRFPPEKESVYLQRLVKNFIIYTFTKYYRGEMGRTGSMHGGGAKCINNFGLEI